MVRLPLKIKEIVQKIKERTNSKRSDLRKTLIKLRLPWSNPFNISLSVRELPIYPSTPEKKLLAPPITPRASCSKPELTHLKTR